MPGIFDIIKYEGDNSTFVWKHPREDFNTLSQLVVHENQEAVFFMNGQALDLFGPGRYTLKTQNIPLIGKVLNLATGGVSPFHCEVYFINKTDQMAVKWGTDSRIQFVEPTYNFPLSIGACGEMALKAVDSKRLLVKLVGTETGFSREQLVSYFRAFLLTKIKAYLSRIIKDDKISIFELDEKLEDFSKVLYEKLRPDFEDYGVSLERFTVLRILRPEGEEQYEKFKELHFRQYADVAEANLRQKTQIIDAETEAQKKVIDSKAEATKRAQEGYTYQQERGFAVAEKIAENEAVGQFTNMGVGLGTMAGVGGAVGGVVGSAVNSAFQTPAPEPTPTPAPAPEPAPEPTPEPAPEPKPTSVPAPKADTGFCENCGTALAEGAAFCEECGTAVRKHTPACPSCGYVFQHEGKFCPKCGAKRGI